MAKKYTNTVENYSIDTLDRDILRVLQSDGRISYRDLGERVGLSANAVGARVGRLVETGVIRGFRAEVNHAALGRGLEAFVDCWLEDRGAEHWGGFVDVVAADERVIDAVHLTGKVDYRLRVVVASATELDELLGTLRREAGIGETDTRLILRRYDVAGSTGGS